MVGYNLVIPHTLENLFHQEKLDQSKINEIMLVCELMMVKDCKVFLQMNKLKLIVLFLRKDEKEMEENSGQITRLKEEIKKMLGLKECAIILNKYSSKMDMESFKNLFI